MLPSNDQLLREVLDDGCSRVRACLVSDHSFGPYSFSVVASDAQAVDVLTDRLFPAASASEFVIYLRVGAAPGWRLAHSGPSHLERIHLTEEGLVGQYDSTTRCWSIYDPVTRRGLFWIDSLESLPEWHRAAPFRSILHWALTDTPYTLAHAGSAGSSLLVGKGGSGKSTTVVACALAGMPTCGDDLVVIGAGRAYPLYDSAKLRAGTNLAVTGGLEFGDKRLYRLTALGDVRETVIRSVVLPVVGTEAVSRSTRCSSSEALLALAPSTVFLLRGNEKSCVSKLASLVRSVPTYRMWLGADCGVTALKELECKSL